MKTKLFLRHAFLPVLILGFMTSCSDNDSPKEKEEEYELTKVIHLPEKSRATAEKLGDFYLSLTANVADYLDATNKEKNFVISPLSVSMVLGMVGNALEGDLKEEIVRYLSTDDLEGINQLSEILLEELPVIDRKTNLKLANSIWVNNEYELRTDFSTSMSKDYRSFIDYFNVQDATKTAQDINLWCASNTGNIIGDYIVPEQINSDLKAMLLNAMYFKSEWRVKDLFDINDTKESPFYGTDGTTSVKMMESKWMGTSCYVDENFTYCTVPFGNYAFSMEIMLPAEGKNLSDMALENCIQMARRKIEFYDNVKIRLPKFNVMGELDLNEILEASGLSSVSSVAPLSLFTKKTDGLISFRQKTVFEIDEKGAKTASVSSAEILDTNSGPSKEPIEINVDKPFIFFITERSTGACIVAGRITDL